MKEAPGREMEDFLWLRRTTWPGMCAAHGPCTLNPGLCFGSLLLPLQEGPYLELQPLKCFWSRQDVWGEKCTPSRIDVRSRTAGFERLERKRAIAFLAFSASINLANRLDFRGPHPRAVQGSTTECLRSHRAKRYSPFPLDDSDLVGQICRTGPAAAAAAHSQKEWGRPLVQNQRALNQQERRVQSPASAGQPRGQQDGFERKEGGGRAQ